jgi:electron transfer flavoprotein alpha subunit
MGSILIVTEIQKGKIREASFELASLAQKVAAASGREVKSLVCGKGIGALAGEFAKKGGGQVYAADHELLENYNVDALNAAIRAAIDASGADLILISNTPTGWDVAPRVAAGLDAGFASDCFGIDVEDGQLVFRRRVFNGKLEARLIVASDKAVASIQPGATPSRGPRTGA